MILIMSDITKRLFLLLLVAICAALFFILRFMHTNQFLFIATNAEISIIQSPRPCELSQIINSLPMKKNCCDDDDFIAKTNDVTTDKVITNNLRSPQKDRLTNRKSIHEINEENKKGGESSVTLNTNFDASPLMRSIIKPIAIVFPQYHQIPENDHFWGTNFTEWTFLKPMDRVVNNILIRKPHSDLGYYNLADYNHRKLMRQFADHFGIYGFCFYHYWFYDHPVMDKALQHMIGNEDYEYPAYKNHNSSNKLNNRKGKGEPNKPFFLCWANEGWSKRWDGSEDEVILAQKYDGEEQSRAHFMYLLDFFRHENYIRVDNRPVFAIYRIEKKHLEVMDKIMTHWQQLAVEHGLTDGIHFLRFLGPFDNSVKSQNIEGYVEFEPGYSWTWKGGGPSVFTNESFDANMYLFNNPDLQRLQKDPVQHYARISETEKLFRTSQFKVYDSEKTWKRILDVNFDDKTKLDYANTYYGTFFYWNNAPRRNYTNQQYWNYPHMLDKVDSAAFQEHLQSMKKKMETRTLPNPSFFPLFQPKFRAPIPKDQFLFLTAWNEWNEQSVLEPNDIDGYDALMAVKYVFKSFPSRTVSELILHIGHRGGGTEKYIGDLMQLFSEYRHIYLGSHELNTSVGMLYKFPHVRVDNDSTILIHVHSAMVGSKAIRWQILHTLSQLCRKGSTKNQGNLCYMTVHDYQWLFPSNPNPNLEFLATFKPQQPNINNCRRLFSMMDRIIYPSRFVRNYYFYVLFEGNPVSLGKILQAIQSDWNFAMMKPLLIGAKESQNTLHEIVGHNDLLQSHNYLNIPGIIESEINIAFVGNFHRLKGSDTFSWLARNLQEIAVHGMKYTLQYHIFGREMEQADCESIGCRKLLSPSDVKSNIIHHGEYTDNKLETLMQQSRIHLVTMLSTFPETWCYALSPILNMGLPLVYFNHGSFLDRIPGFLHQDNPMKVDDRSLEQAQLHREDFEAFYIESKLTKYFPIEMTENGYTYDENILLYKMNEAITFAIKHTNKTYGFQRQSKQIQPRKWYILNYPKPMDEN